MRCWELAIEIDPAREQPLFLQLANAIAEDIRRGRLKPGDALPGSRELAELLGINRNTVIAGYAELAAEGLVVTRIGGGTFVAPPIPAVQDAPETLAALPTYALAPPPPSQIVSTPAAGALLLSRSTADLRLLPARALARAFRRAIGQNGRRTLTYTDPRGHARLRGELAAMLTRTRGMLATADDVLITRSIEQGLDLVARTLITPGQAVAVESWGYPLARRLLRMAGARLLPLPMDEQGLDVAALETLLAGESLRAVLLMPHHHFPTNVVMPQQRRAHLAELSLRHGFAIIEDDYDHEFHYEGKPLLPIASGPARGNVIYVASMANLLAPGLGTGFVVAPPPVLQRLVALRATADAEGDAAVECAIAELFEDGELLRHVRRMRRLYATRRDALAASLVRHLGSALDFRVPEGGMALWTRIDGDIDAAAWSAAGEREGVWFRAARDCDFFHRDASHMRLGFSYHDPVELGEAVRRMARALAKVRVTRPVARVATATLRGTAQPRSDATAAPPSLARQSPHRAR